MPASTPPPASFVKPKFKHTAVDEFELIQTCFARSAGAAGVTVGIGDDGAVLQPDPGKELIAVMDTLVAGVHFPRATDPFDIGYRVVAVNLSDVAAMAAKPRWMTLALTLPMADQDWLQRFAGGLRAAADPHELALVGGDTTSGSELVVTVQIIADVPRHAALLRSGARVGDHIYVTGTVGDAAGGLQLMTAGQSDDYLTQRLLRPNARVTFGRLLQGVASAAIDVSDGLYADTSKLLAASGVGGIIELAELPLSAPLQQHFSTVEQRQLALSGGDDYEICFTVAADRPLPHTEVQLTRIGTVTDSPILQCFDGGELVPFTDSGYRHFQ